MRKYDIIKSDMNESLKNGNKARRTVLADIVAAIDKASIAGKTRVEITDTLVNEVLTKYKKTVQEMIDTCPDTEQYAVRKTEYQYNMTVVNEYAPQMITDEIEIAALINKILTENNFIGTEQPKGIIMKTVMPVLKVNNCDMKVAQGILNKLIK